MSMSDPIADMLTRVRNGVTARKKTVSMPASRMKEAVANLLKKQGYIKDVSVQDENGKKTITIGLKYFEGKGAIEEIQRISRPGKRVYCGAVDMPHINGGLGVIMVSTSRGLITDKEARSAKIGGELICKGF